MTFGSATPIFRIFDEARAREFYVGFLEFTIDFEHRFEPGLPLYMQVSKGACQLHLSEHHGDACPGGHVRIETADVAGFQQHLLGKKYKFARPGVQEQPWGTREMTVGDPFGNRLTFFEQLTLQ